jgi:hypothetical protein
VCLRIRIIAVLFNYDKVGLRFMKFKEFLQVKLFPSCDTSAVRLYTGRFIMFCMITNIYNKKTKGPTLMDLFTATGKLKKFFLTTRDVRLCTTGDTAHTDTIFKFLSHTRQHGCIDILHRCNDPCL